MKLSEAMQILGGKLQEKYGYLGFKYKKSDRTFTKHSKNFTYTIAFFSFGGNTKETLSLDVCYIINRRPYDPRPSADSQLLYYSLWENEIYCNAANEEKIDETYKIVCQWMEKILLPKMNELIAEE